MSTTISTTSIKDVFTVEHAYLAIATVINLSMYGMILTNTEFPGWIQYSSLKMASLLNAPLHALAVLASVGRFLFNRHRLRRMGLTGVVHAMANVACIVLSYGILLPQLFPPGHAAGFVFSDTMKSREFIVTQIHALSCLVSAVGATGLLWMISVSKKHLRFFACAIFTSAAIGMGELDRVTRLSGSNKVLQIIVCIVSTLMALISFTDVWSSFVLVFFERQVRPQTKSQHYTSPVVEKHPLISSAAITQHLPRTACIIWESFRNAECILHFLPRMEDEVLQGRRARRGTAGHEHAVLKPSISWLIYSLGEMGVNTILLCNCFYADMFRYIPNQAPTLFNFYGMVTFGVTLALKGIISSKTFKLFLAHNLLATSFVNLANAPGLFFDHVGGLIMLGTLVSVMTWQYSEKKSMATATVPTPNVPSCA